LLSRRRSPPTRSCWLCRSSPCWRSSHTNGAGRINSELELRDAYRGTAFLLGDVVEADDAYTGAHSREVVDLTLSVVDELGLSPRERRERGVRRALHDVGKVRIPNSIINKPEP
jgi:HD-GYP domain-containing protein (c-di-GMP phosphodiesterase class II)